MKKFMDKDFLLETETAKTLYHEYAKKMPIFDFHCHINPKDIAQDKVFSTITDIWLGGDHYKWRAMRANGIDEQYITGSKNDYDKFIIWAKTVPYTIGNPLYHWTHLELKKYFDITEQLSEKTADSMYKSCNEKLKTMSAKEIIRQSDVKAICTTDDPIDSLEYHKLIKDDSSFDVKVLPTFRPDNAVHVEKDGFNEWLDALSRLYGNKITCFSRYKSALIERIDYFNSVGCKISDHSIETLEYADSTDEEIDSIFALIIGGIKLSGEQLNKFKTAMYIFLGREYNKRNWVMQYHIGALRNNSTRMLSKLGADTGFDSMSDTSYAEDLTSIMDRLDSTEELPKTILYCLNPKDNEMLAAIAGSYQDGKVRGKVQFGSAWWFNDQKDGMLRQMEAMCQVGLISTSIGMLTDSRSLLSYTRHEYFRRILCNKFGNLVEDGEYPNDIQLVGKIVQDICYNNSVKYFNIEDM